MNNHLIKKLFECIENPVAERMWIDILKKYQSQNSNVINIKNPDNQWTLLHYAAENIFPYVTEWLIEQGAEIDARDSGGNTPFLIALDAAIDAAVQENRDEIDFSVVNILL